MFYDYSQVFGNFVLLIVLVRGREVLVGFHNHLSLLGKGGKKNDNLFKACSFERSVVAIILTYRTFERVFINYITLNNTFAFLGT